MTPKRLEGIKAVIFDMGDTLYTLPYSIDDYHMKFLREIFGDDLTVTCEEIDRAQDKAENALDELIYDIATGPHYFFSTEEWIYFDCVLLESLGFHEDIAEKARRYQLLWDRLLKSQPNLLREGAKEVLEELASRGYMMGVATNWTESPHDLLTISGVRHLFRSLQWTIVKGYSKPSPYMLIMNAQELGVNPIRCAFVGNKVNLDVEAARRAGMKPVLLAQSSELVNENVDDVLVISNLSELLDYLPKY